MEIAKALILVGEAGGERPWAPAPASPRELFPVANRPVLFHHLEALRRAGVLEAVVLSHPHVAATIALAVGDGHDFQVAVRHGVMDPARGVAGALQMEAGFVGDEPVLVQDGGALLEPIHTHISAFAREELDALGLRVPGSTAPRSPGYLLSSRAVEIVRDGDAAGDLVDGVLAAGGRARVQQVDGCLPCQGDSDALLEANRRMLEGLSTRVDPASLEETQVQGPVVVHPSARVHRSVLRGPLIVGPDARISESYVGPYTSIGGSVEIEGTEIEHSIVLREASLRYVGGRIESSVIGRAARVGRRFQLPSALRLTVGEGAEVALS